MRAFGKWTGRVLLALFLLLGGIWLFGPEEPVDLEISFDENDLPEDLDRWLTERETQFSDIVPGTEKRILWVGDAGVRTPLSVVYIHGFSGSSEEIRPVPDQVSAALGANLFFTRLTGHGRGGPAMAEAVAGDWLEDTAEALAVGRAIGDEVIVIASSTGGTLAAIAATDANLIYGVKGIVFHSPNFRLQNPSAWILTMPLARYWGPAIGGRELGFDPISEDHRKFWTTRYPSVAAVPMGALVKHARALDYSGVTTPAFFIYAPADEIVSARETERVIGRWAGLVEVLPVTLPPGDDARSHVLAGRVMSPRNTTAMVEAILAWVEQL